ncbi:MAG: hypothetical protein ACLFVB_03065 [Thermoplasmata archaeon]
MSSSKKEGPTTPVLTESNPTSNPNFTEDVDSTPKLTYPRSELRKKR